MCFGVIGWNKSYSCQLHYHFLTPPFLKFDIVWGYYVKKFCFLTLLLLSYLIYRHIQATFNSIIIVLFASIFETLNLFKLLILVLEIVKNDENVLSSHNKTIIFSTYHAYLTILQLNNWEAKKLNLVIWSVTFSQNILTFDSVKEFFISCFFHI